MHIFIRAKSTAVPPPTPHPVPAGSQFIFGRWASQRSSTISRRHVTMLCWTLTCVIPVISSGIAARVSLCGVGDFLLWTNHGLHRFSLNVSVCKRKSPLPRCPSPQASQKGYQKNILSWKFIGPLLTYTWVSKVDVWKHEVCKYWSNNFSCSGESKASSL